MIKYSIIIPVHNSAATLPQTMQSVFAQMKQFDEIILVENASTDNSLAQCYAYQKKDERVKVLESKKAGLSLARNLGIKASTGDYLFLLDADDTIQEPLLLELDYLVRTLLKSGQAFDLYEINFNHYFSQEKYVVNPFILPKGSYKADAYLNKTMELFQEESKFMAWRFLYHKAFFTAHNRFFNEDIFLFEDIAFMQRYLTKDVTIYVTGHTPLVNYLFHELSLTKTTDAALARALKQVYHSIEQPSAQQSEYFLALACKMLSQEEFVHFAKEEEHYTKEQAFLQYQKLKTTSFFRRLKRRLGRVYDS